MNPPIKVTCYHQEQTCDACTAWQAYFDRQWEVLSRLATQP